MSDPEAGDSEAVENPEPEDDAHLSASTCSATRPGTESSQSHQASTDVSEDFQCSQAENGASDLAQSSNELNQLQQRGTGELCENDLKDVEPSENQAQCPVNRGDEAVGEGKTLAQKDWPPESDRSDSNSSHTNVGADQERMEEGAEGFCSKSALAESECNTSVDVGQTVGCNAELQPAGVLVSESVTTETSDQEESPPEDELFSVGSSAAPEPSSAVTQSRTSQSDVCSSCTESDHIPENVDAGSFEVSLPSSSTEADCSASQICPEANDSVQSAPDVSNVSNSLSLATQPVRVVTGQVQEKEDDQIPECDREQSQHTSPVVSGQRTQLSADSAVLLAQINSSDSGVSSQTAETAETPDISPAQHSSTKSLPESVNKQQESLCDKSSCDDETVSVQSSISSQLQPMTNSPTGESNTLLKAPILADDDSEDEDLLSELDAELHLRCSPRRRQMGLDSSSVRLPLNGLKDVTNSELCKQFEQQLLQLQETVLQREREISRLKDINTRQREVSQEVIAERDKLKAELTAVKDKNPDDLYLPQIKELEYTISQQQGEIRQLKEKLTSHDGAAKRAIATLQTEMKARMDQITKLYEETSKEKDAMVVKFAEAETKNIEAKCAEEKLESRVRDLLKEKEFNNNKMRAALAEKQKAAADLKAKTGEMATVQKEMEKLKEEMSSMDFRIKWHQNKLKTELEAHKETKASLEKMTVRLKEAKEETEIIRSDCQAIVKTYQESEEVRSNSLDKELKMKQTELMIKMKEQSDTEEIHQKTKKELDSLKAHHKDVMEELKTLKDKVHCLEEERLQGEQVQAKYQNIIQNQKSDNAGLSKQLNSLQTLQEDFDRAQEMIRTLDHEVNELKLANRDLQKDIESCQARESKMLTLQSELSRTNALLRSENTNLNNQVATLSGEVQKMKMDIQDLETRSRNMSDALEEEQNKRNDETASLSTQLAVKTKESEEYRQKWEDEIDANKTWKRKHNNNVKDLTRQLLHAKKRLEAYESGSGDRDGTSMGSRTNSNGSLNSMDNSNQHSTNHQGGGQHNHHPSHPHSGRGPSQEPECPVITEQVEVDRQLLIERIVRLQRSLARKNEKLDFLEEHIQQLVTEIKKKNRIIQGYVVREEAGTLVSDTMDANKLAVRKEAQALLARKGGIMASVYSQHQQDGAMTLDLSLEINKKLQAVLEDTLLKNMTLKENIDTLGAEIARLSQENRKLQLRLQGLDTQ